MSPRPASTSEARSTAAARRTMAPADPANASRDGVAEAPAAVQPREEVHPGAGAQDVHRREVGAVELE